MQDIIKETLHKWALDLVAINLNREFDYSEARYQADELYKKLLEKLDNKLR